jgi:hypothetical protein
MLFVSQKKSTEATQLVWKQEQGCLPAQGKQQHDRKQAWRIGTCNTVRAPRVPRHSLEVMRSATSRTMHSTIGNEQQGHCWET